MALVQPAWVKAQQKPSFPKPTEEEKKAAREKLTVKKEKK